MLKTVYIGNLEWKTTLDELKDFFSPYGQVTSVDIIKDRTTGMSKGFGFVTLENADKAIEELNGKEFRGRTVKINEAREREKREYNPRPEPRYSSDHRDSRPPRYGYRDYEPKYPPPRPTYDYHDQGPREPRYHNPHPRPDNRNHNNSKKSYHEDRHYHQQHHHHQPDRYDRDFYAY